jgi:hypothetical protein
MDAYTHAARQASVLFALGHRRSWQDAQEYAWKLRTLNGLAQLDTGVPLYPAGWELVGWRYADALLPDLCIVCRAVYTPTWAGRLRYGCPACNQREVQAWQHIRSLAAILSWQPELMEQLYLQWLAANPAYQQSTAQCA